MSERMKGHPIAERSLFDPWHDLPDWAKDAVTTDVDVHFSLKDRLQILFTGWLWVRVRVFTENLPGRTEGMSKVYPRRIRWPWKKQILFGAVEVRRDDE